MIGWGSSDVGAAEPTQRTIGVAVAIPDPYGAELQRWRAAFDDPLARSIPTHITLVPPAPVTGTALAMIEEHLAAVAATERAFPILLSGTGTFRPVSPVVFVALADGIGACERLEHKVRSGPLSATSRFPYHPHVTVAHDLADAVLDRAFKELAHYRARFSVCGFALYEHGPDGVWRPRRAFPFGSAAEADAEGGRGSVAEAGPDHDAGPDSGAGDRG